MKLKKFWKSWFNSLKRSEKNSICILILEGALCFAINVFYFHFSCPFFEAVQKRLVDIPSNYFESENERMAELLQEALIDFYADLDRHSINVLLIGDDVFERMKVLFYNVFHELTLYIPMFSCICWSWTWLRRTKVYGTSAVLARKSWRRLLF